LTLPTLLVILGVLRGLERSHSKRSLVKDTEHQERGCGASPNPNWDGFLRCEKLMIEQSQQSAI
jgi:hypothetical protein